MKKDKIIFWTSTGILSLMMGFSAYSYFTSPDVVKGFEHLGFPSYFRVELGVAKLLGALALIVPIVPNRIKEWAYAGFGINFISAFIAHLSTGDAFSNSVGPLVFLLVLVVSYVFHHKITDSSH